jgi:vitamin K-dependent gamma-carboxylase
MRDAVRHLRARFSAPADVASLAAFRILFGLLMAASVARFMAKGWVHTFFVEPAAHFPYPAFSFVRPWPPPWMYVHYACLLVLALGMALGCCYRVCAFGFLFGFTYVELIDQSLYLNHYYLVSLLAALLAVLPAGRAFSLDAWRRPERAVSTIPVWVLAALRFQVGLVYVFAGVAKLNHDWLVEAQPLRIWLAACGAYPVIGPWLATREAAVLASWLGAAFDLGIVGVLLARRTRPLGVVLVLVFHAATGLLFPIGIFPWLMSVGATVLLSPAWPRRALEWLCARLTGAPGAPGANGPHPAFRSPAWLAPVLAAHCFVQAVLPLRQHFAGSKSAWTLDGFNFAWNVMVAEKAGAVSFRAEERSTGKTQRVEPELVLAPFQVHAMAQDPELVREGALLVAERLRREGHDVAVYADAVATLNGRPAHPLVDPTVDLTGPLPTSWILPLE